jgi:hypothetical protein
MPVHANFVDTLEQVGDLALGKVGEKKRLTNIETDTGNHAEVIRLFIHQVIREVQSEFRWSELTKSVELESPIAENDDTYQYTLPSDFLRPASNRDQDYIIENGYLFTSVAENFPFRYIRYSENPAEWSGLMVKCVFFRLALEICMPLTENAQKYNSLLEEYEKVVFPRAKMVGSFDTENPRPRIARGRYSRTRGGVGGAIAGAFNRVIGIIAPGHNHDTDYMPLVATNKISTPFLQDGSVTADKLSVDAKALATDADAIVLQDAKDYADLAETAAIAAAAADASAKDGALALGLYPNIVQGMLTAPYTVTGGAIPNWQNVTGLVAEINRRSNSSYFRIRAVVYGTTLTAATQPMLIKITQNGNDIGGLVSGNGNRIACHGSISGPTDANEMECCVIDFLHDPGTTPMPPITFRVQACVQHATNAGTINATRTDTDSTAFSRTMSTLIVEEIFCDRTTGDPLE